MLSDVEGPDFSLERSATSDLYCLIFSSLRFNLLLTFLTLRLGLDTGAGSTDSMVPFSSSDGFLWGKKGSLNKSAIC